MELEAEGRAQMAGELEAWGVEGGGLDLYVWSVISLPVLPTTSPPPTPPAWKKAERGAGSGGGGGNSDD